MAGKCASCHALAPAEDEDRTLAKGFGQGSAECSRTKVLYVPFRADK